jgi:hypothetical protein
MFRSICRTLGAKARGNQAYLRELLEGSLESEFHRARAIFISHGGVGKTSLIRALHNEDVVEGKEEITRGVAIDDAIHEKAGVFTRMTAQTEKGLTVHFWDFGAQVMAHATHQFFLRSRCLYVVVLDARAERNSNEEAEYWLEHVRAFGEGAPVLIVGNKSDQVQVNLDLKSLRDKYPNIIDFFALSCTGAKGRFKLQFELFRQAFETAVQDLGKHGERCTARQFSVLKEIQSEALREDFLPRHAFVRICEKTVLRRRGLWGVARSSTFSTSLGL